MASTTPASGYASTASVIPIQRPRIDGSTSGPVVWTASLRIMGLQALLKVNIRLATTDYLSNGYDGL